MFTSSTPTPTESSEKTIIEQLIELRREFKRLDTLVTKASVYSTGLSQYIQGQSKNKETKSTTHIFQRDFLNPYNAAIDNSRN